MYSAPESPDTDRFVIVANINNYPAEERFIVLLLCSLAPDLCSKSRNKIKFLPTEVPEKRWSRDSHWSQFTVIMPGKYIFSAKTCPSAADESRSVLPEGLSQVFSFLFQNNYSVHKKSWQPRIPCDPPISMIECRAVSWPCSWCQACLLLFLPYYKGHLFT